MKRPFGITPVLASGALLLVGWYIAIAVIAPPYLLRVIQRVTGGRLQVERVHISPLLRVTLTGVRSETNSLQAGLSIQRVTFTPRWISPRSKRFWLTAVRFDRPVMRVMRTSTDTIVWPELSWPARTASHASWHVEIGSVTIVDGTAEWIDETPTTPFHGALDHVSFEAGGVTLPWRDSQLTFAIRGLITGHGGHGAPAYCSGWLELGPKDFQITCQLEPLPLIAFDPYCHGPTELRVYTITLRSTSQWEGASNELTGRIQLELNNLSEGDLSIRGRTIADIKRLIASEDPRMRGELTLSGPVDDPGRWSAEFLPGDTMVQQLIKRLLNRGVEMVKVPFLGRKLPVNIAPGSEAKMTDIEMASREVQEALELLTASEIEATPPAPELVPPMEEPVLPTEQGAPAAAPPAAPAEQPAAASTEMPAAPETAPAPTAPPPDVQPQAPTSPPPAAR